MSNIYINEPPTSGKVLLKTTVGDIDIELWSREAPKACRNFIQLCMEGYYNNTIFHRVVKGFIVQGGDPTGTGLGGESIYGQPFRDEFHQRLRFVRRGLVGMANAGKDDNGSQFFFTLAPCPDLQNKHTIFGKITGNTLYNMLKLEESQVDRNEKPLYPHKILAADILSNPFPDIVPRVTPGKRSEKRGPTKEETKGKKDFKLLSFGDEAEEEEEEINGVISEFRGKSKSSHDLLTDDPKLSSIPAIDTTELEARKEVKKKKKEKRRKADGGSGDGSGEDSDSDKERRKKARLERIRKKLGKDKRSEDKEVSGTSIVPEEMNFDYNTEGISDKLRQEKEKLDNVRQEFNALKKQIAAERRKKVEVPDEYKEHENPAVEAFRKQAEKYKEATKSLPRKGSSRQEQTFQMLEKFRQRLECQKVQKAEKVDEEEHLGPLGVKDQSWLAHEFKCQKEETVLAKDANMRGEADWYDIYDPRNPINIRRREGVLLPEEMAELKKPVKK